MNNYDNGFQKCKTQRIYIERNQVSNSIECKLSSYTIRTIKKLYTPPLVLSFDHEYNREDYEKTKHLLSDPAFDILLKRKVHSWTRSTKPLIALLVPRDGNSLCHSVSVLMCGIIDKSLFFRKCLHLTCMTHLQDGSPLYQRWSEFLEQIFSELGKRYTEEAFRREWSHVCYGSSPQPISLPYQNTESNLPIRYSPLQQFHIFVFAQICRRTIVVASLEEGGFKSSIYLPVTIPVSECIKSPLYMSCHDGHFAPLVFVDEVDTVQQINDLCFPIVDNQFNLYEFPYLFDFEDGMSLLQQYCRPTIIGYTTKHEFKELPALRMITPEFKSLSGCIETEFDPNTYLKLCLEGLSRNKKPSDVIDLWFASFVADETEEEHMQTSSALHQATEQPMSIAFQPEEDSDDDACLAGTNQIDNDSMTHCKNHFGSSLKTPEQSLSLSSNKINHSNVHQLNKLYSNVSSNSSNKKSSGYCSSLTTPSSAKYSLECQRQKPNDVYSSSRNDDLMDANEPETRLFHSIDVNEHFSQVDLTQSLNQSVVSRNENITQSTTQADVTSQQDFPNGFTVVTYSTNRVKILRPHKIILFISKLMIESSSDNSETVEFRLLKDLNADEFVKLKLIYQCNVSVTYQTTTKDEFTIELKKLSGNLLLYAVVPSSVMSDAPPEPITGASTISMIPSEAESQYFDYLDNSNKCRTAGCMNRAVRRFRYLCSSCNDSWSRMPRRSTENYSFSYYDSITSIESRVDDGSCQNRNCRREGVPEYYGFCPTCFYASGL